MCGQSARHAIEQGIAALARRQHDVVSHSQLLGAGLSRRQISYRVEVGRLLAIHRGVYCVGKVLSPKGRLMAAVLAYGDDTALSHQTAAHHWNLRASTATLIDVVVPSYGGRQPRAGIKLHRTRWLPADQTTTVDGIPITSVPRTLLDLAAVLRHEDLRRTVENAERLRLFDLQAVNELLRRGPQLSGRKRLARVLEHDWHEPPFTRSDLERLAYDLCSESGIGRPSVNAGVGGYEVDLLWERERLIVEVDARRTHGTRRAFEEDRLRDAKLALLGYQVVRLTPARIMRRREEVLDDLGRLLELRAGDGG